jgi:membrane-bound serine protease (ClpP class)
MEVGWRWLSPARHTVRAAFAALALVTWSEAAAQERSIVYVVPISGVIDMGLAPFVERVLGEATAAGAAAVVLRINTFGGRADAAVVIRDALLAASVPTVAYVEPRAISAGALIALAAERVAMVAGGTIGAATPVMMGAPGAAPAAVEEKTVSYVRSEFRATALARGRPPLVAEAMVDANVEVPGLIERGRLLTMTTEEALEHRIVDFRGEGLLHVLEQIGIVQPEIRVASLNWGERIVRLITNPIVAPLLLSVAMLGILIEIRTPGVGIPGAVGLGSLALVLWGHTIVQLVGWEQLLLIGLGLVLIALEIFVIPGFGIAGALGIAAVLGGFTMTLVGQGATARAIFSAVGRVGLATVGAVIVGILLMRFLPRLPFGRRLMLETGLPAGAGHTPAAAVDRSWIGREGRTVSALRPSGTAEFGETMVEVVAESGMIEPGVLVVITRVDGTRIAVRRHTSAEEAQP